MKLKGFLQTGQTTCHDARGWEIPCAGSGQDAEFGTGIPWPSPRFQVKGETALDHLTGLIWTRNANPAEFPLDWQAARDYIAQMNNEQTLGFDDWRLPGRRELRSLISHQTRNPALPEDHPFTNVFLGWYWTSTTAAINRDFAWYIHMEGGRTFYGAKNQYYLLWPVRGEGNGTLPVTGEQGTAPHGYPWPYPRFEVTRPEGDSGALVFDRLTGLYWGRSANVSGEPVVWEDALKAVEELNGGAAGTGAPAWRLPNINELESLVDLSRHAPALHNGHPFTGCQEVYWSSTTSMFEPDWAWALYMNKGAVGVGRKEYARFHVWAVRDGVFQE